MASKRVKRCLTSAVIREIQIKITKYYHYPATKMVKIKNKRTPSGRQDVEQLQLSFTVSRHVNKYNYLENHLEVTKPDCIPLP